MTVLVWSATGLAGLFAHGAWPQGVTFTRTPGHAPPDRRPPTTSRRLARHRRRQLSGYGLFWGLFIGQLMVLLVLTSS